MKRVLLAGFASFLFACGGGPKAPALRNFNYGSPTTPSGSQITTATTAESSLQSIAGVGGQASTPTSAPTLADSLTSDLGGGSFALFAPLPAAVRTQVQNSAIRGVQSAALTVGNQNCVSTSATQVSYNNCSYNGDGFNGTLNGSISITPNQQITWDITYTINGSSQGVSVNGSFHWYGQVAWTASTIKGYGRSEYVITASGNGQSVEVAYTSGFDVDVTYITTPSYCIASGTLELRRVVGGKDASQTGLHDGAWKFTWTPNGSACGTLTIAIGT